MYAHDAPAKHLAQPIIWQIRRGARLVGDDDPTWNRPCAITTSTHSVFLDSTSPPKLNPVEPPWYGPVCPVVGEGWHREVSPHPNQREAIALDRRRSRDNISQYPLDRLFII
jgi:hypothetical protein